MKITALEILKSWCNDAIYAGDNCKGIILYRVYGKEMSTLVSKNEIKDFWEYVKAHKTLYKKLTSEEKDKLSYDFDNYTKQTGATCSM